VNGYVEDDDQRFLQTLRAGVSPNDPTTSLHVGHFDPGSFDGPLPAQHPPLPPSPRSMSCLGSRRRRVALDPVPS